ncbi:MAG: HU family DNA-binding protein [Aeriscardovia sp.]|nr:HU family DNA-binding protein [Aeriscardovia sp.]MBQ1301650.1 HU family DNA-binding protein [Aeriscardovia sp.]MBQ1357539.1 HU family DNA-binding protein [Aeriscardovia sp.]MBQ1425041.1 HU family DNA-binding protein [Aeriscardovia sp.]MBQ5493204.1 HU family DNA-binding protein [Aeriscardovia sp.]
MDKYYGKTEITASVAQKADLTREEAKKAVDAFLDTLLECAQKGIDVRLAGYFSLERVERAARSGRNPQTGEAMEIPAREVVKLTAGKTLKDAVQGNK